MSLLILLALFIILFVTPPIAPIALFTFDPISPNALVISPKLEISPLVIFPTASTTFPAAFPTISTVDLTLLIVCFAVLTALTAFLPASVISFTQEVKLVKKLAPAVPPQKPRASSLYSGVSSPS